MELKFKSHQFPQKWRFFGKFWIKSVNECSVHVHLLYITNFTLLIKYDLISIFWLSSEMARNYLALRSKSGLSFLQYFKTVPILEREIRKWPRNGEFDIFSKDFLYLLQLFFLHHDNKFFIWYSTITINISFTDHIFILGFALKNCRLQTACSIIGPFSSSIRYGPKN